MISSTIEKNEKSSRQQLSGKHLTDNYSEALEAHSHIDGRSA